MSTTAISSPATTSIPVVSPGPVTTGPIDQNRPSPTPAWNGTIGDQQWVCTTANNTITVTCCDQFNGTLQLHDVDVFKNVEMCLFTGNTTTMLDWGKCLGKAQSDSPYHWGAGCKGGNDQFPTTTSQAKSSAPASPPATMVAVVVLSMMINVALSALSAV